MITYDYRCDAPDTERRMRMSIIPVVGPRGAIMALYQSQLIDETSQLPLGLLSMDLRAGQANARQEPAVLLMGSLCRDIAWPMEERNAM